MTETLLVADYSALEIVILADLCKRLFGDTQLEEMVAPGADDIHVVNAQTVFGQHLGWTVPELALVEGKKVACTLAGHNVRDIPVAQFKSHPHGAILRGMIKTTWYKIQYGGNAYGLSTMPGPDGKPIGEAAAQRMLDALEKAVPGPFKWQAWCRDFVDEWHGIYSLDGRWCSLDVESADNAPDWLRARGYRRAYNFPMQAAGAGIIGDAMVRVGRDERWHATGFRVCLQVHDELVARGPLDNVGPAGERLKLNMESATANGVKLLVPLQVKVDHGPNYFDAK